jgi:hypothetical protein
LCQEGSSGLEQPLEAPTQLRRVVARLDDVPLDVLDGGLEDVQGIPQRIELVPGHDELRLAEAELLGPTTGLVVALAARTAAVLRRSTRAAGHHECPTAPPAPLLPGLFRHCGEI